MHPVIPRNSCTHVTLSCSDAADIDTHIVEDLTSELGPHHAHRLKCAMESSNNFTPMQIAISRYVCDIDAEGGSCLHAISCVLLYFDEQSLGRDCLPAFC